MGQKPIVHFSSFGLLPFMISGLSSGLTPCRFTVIVFFIMMLLLIKKGTMAVRFAGGCFVAAIFITSFFLYWGIFEGFRSLVLFDAIAKLVYLFVAVLSVTLGALHMFDWARYRLAQSENKLILKIPPALGENKKETSAGKSSLLIHYGLPAALSGFVVGVIQSQCMGRNYLSTMVSMLEANNKEIQAVFNVLLYDVMSIIPLFLAYFFILKIVKSEKAAKRIRKNISKYKIMAGAVFLGLGFGLIYMFL